ncbi:asparaginase [Roseomonas terrae]|jgi:L-asparaginase II|uniref:Asparaginase n=1 Tax=Neoroseomonas terrae TaxID=424799 RepID=A0ABS5ENV0_9PROT|nr:asparaginase [Neoroseomonas terrae]MBR0652696.1 asparaginase [Neoroseomonas terrae]
MSFVPLAEIRRGGILESLHYGVAVVADAEGRILQSWGDPAFATFPRSSLKPFQAIPLVETGAADAAGLTEEHLALACASHSAEDFQVALVRGWLDRLGLTESALVCGPDMPRSQADQSAIWRSGGDRSRVYHNCSGKHCGFLTLTKHLGAPVATYNDPAHPAQRLYIEAFSELLGEDASSLPRGIDGCGLPAIALPMRAMARAAARWAAARVATDARRTAIRRLQSAIRAYPDHLSGRDSATGKIVRATQGRVLLKGGAEGFVVGFVPDQGLGIAVKFADGASRAKMGVFAALLGRLGLADAAESLADEVEGDIRDSNGNTVGVIKVTLPA